MIRSIRGWTLRCALGGAAAFGLLCAPVGGLSAVAAHAADEVRATYDCASAGTIVISGHPNAAAGYRIVNSTEYHTFVGHEFWVYDSHGSLVYHFVNGTEGNIPDLVSCTSQGDGFTVVALVALH